MDKWTVCANLTADVPQRRTHALLNWDDGKSEALLLSLVDQLRAHIPWLEALHINFAAPLARICALLVIHAHAQILDEDFRGAVGNEANRSG